MKLSAQTIRELLKQNPPLVTNVSDRLAKPLEGSKLDLTLNSVSTLKLSGMAPFMGLDLRITPPTQEVEPNPLPCNPKLGSVGIGWVLFPGFYLLQTTEQLNMPYWLIGNIKERTTLFRNGTICRVTDADPGFSGNITCALYVPPGSQLTIEKGARFLSIRFEPIVTLWLSNGKPCVFNIAADPTETDPYNGIWSGNKRSTEGAVERGY